MSAITKMNIGRLMEYFLATGNLVSRTGLGLSQTSGFTVVADKLNYMVCAKELLTLFFLRPHNHIHHILFINKFVIITIITFASTPNIAIPFALSICASRSLFCRAGTTTVRKLLPESWGFLCPVHTPDGSPCGLLNHLSASCFVHVTPTGRSDAACQDMLSVLRVLSTAGVMLVHGRVNDAPTCPEYLTVMVDGAVAGFTADQCRGRRCSSPRGEGITNQ